MQIAGGDSGGTVRALTWAGCKVSKWMLSCDEKGFLMLKPTIDGVSESIVTGLAAASYASTAVPLSYTGGSIKIAGSEVPVAKFSVSGETGLKVDRYAMRGASSQLKREQLESDLRKYTGTIDAEFESLALYEKYSKDENVEMTANFEGPLIAGTYHYGVELVFKAVRFEGKTPNVSGPGLIEVSTPFTITDSADGNGGVLLTYTTTDNAI
jgi:hypothetical protein